VAGGEPGRFKRMSARFSAPVLPGDTLVTSIWREPEAVLFLTRNGDGTLVLSHGEATIEGAVR
jgi:acyl dehydratase